MSLLSSGTRAETDMGWGPDYGPYNYTLLREPALAQELTRLSGARVCGGGADAVSLQPNPDPENANQDRYVVCDWEISGGRWRLLAVFDGHAGHETAEYAEQALPARIQSALKHALATAHPHLPSPSTISALLASTIRAFDDSLADGLCALFPGGADALEALSDDDIRKIANDPALKNHTHDLVQDRGTGRPEIVRCMRGSTALVSLVSLDARHLWVASLGDSRAVLGERRGLGKWNVRVLSADHNGTNPAEAARVRSAHPGEDACVLNGRVLGAIAVTRALGDQTFKLPPVYTRRVFLNTDATWQIHTRLSDFLPRSLTPPYLSADAEVVHLDLGAKVGDESEDVERLLILCSDGLFELDESETSPEALGATWLEAASGSLGDQAGGGNRALHVLRAALGGTDVERVSRLLTVEMAEKWMDDTTVVVQVL